MAQRGPIVVVTGSSGLLGSRLCKRLKESYTVVGMDHDRPAERATVDEYVYIDLTSNESVEQSFRVLTNRFGINIASCVHLAAYHEFSGDDNPLYQKVSIDGTRRLLDELKKIHVGQIVFSSTMLVHKPTLPGVPFNEDWPIQPKWPHPESKVETEKLLLEGHGDIPLVVLRLAGFYDEMGHSIPLAYQIKRILERSATSTVYPGDVSHGESYVHIEDVIDAFVNAIAHRKDLPNEFVALIGEPETMSYDERQKMFARLIHGDTADDWVTREIPKAIAKAGTWLEEVTPYDDKDPFTATFAVDLAGDHFELDTARARNALGWEPQHRLRYTIPAMIANLRRDPLAFYKENKLEPNDAVRELARSRSWR
jgi:nucleoside-diphosphate-sugar epimerase